MNGFGKRFATILLTAAAFAVAPASADVIDYTLGTGNDAISGYTGPYQTLEVDLTSATTATLTFDSLVNGGNLYLMGDGGSVAANVNADDFSFSATGSNSIAGFTPGPYSNSSAGNEDGFGSFNLRVTSFDGFTHSSTEIVVLVTNLSGTWATAADVLTGNSLDNVAATHTFVCADPCSPKAGALATGFASVGSSGGPPTSGFVPEPGTIALLGLGLGALGLRRKRAVAA